MKFIKNDELETILPDWKGNPFDGNEFQYIDKAFRPDFRKIFKWQFFGEKPQRKEKKQDKWRPVVREDISYLDRKDDFIVWLGHAVFLIQINGVKIITDPVFYNLAILPRFVKLPFDIRKLKGVDYVLLSHDHRDHCDKKSMTNLLKHNNAEVLTSLKMSDVIKKWVGGNPIQEAGWYQKYKTKAGIEIIFLPSRHWCRRGLLDFNRRLWGSFIIRTKTTTIYFGADSASGKHFQKIGQLFPSIDIAILGIGAYKPPIIMQDVHTSPSEAVEAFQQLGAKKMIPMHYGTYDLSDEPASEPYRFIQKSFEEKDKRENLLLLDAGEAYQL